MARKESPPLTLRLGLVAFDVRQNEIRVPEKRRSTGKKLICPDCTEPHPPKQKYVCEQDENHGPYSRNECDYALPKGEGDNKTLVRLTEEDLEKLAGADTAERRDLDIQVYDADVIERSTIYKELAYFLKPATKAHVKHYALMRDVIERNQDKAFLGVTELRKGTAHLARLEVFGEYLALFTLERPTNIKNDIEEWATTFWVSKDESEIVNLHDDHYTDNELEQMGQLVDACVEDFNPEAFASEVADVAEAIVNGEQPEVPEEPPVTKEIDLSAAIAAAKARKAA